MKDYLLAPTPTLLLIIFLMIAFVPLNAIASDQDLQSDPLKNALSRLRFSGLVEVEASDDDNENDGDSSAIDLATIELGLDSDVSEKIKAHLLILWEENDTEPAEVDEATITFTLPRNSELTAGKMYLPFGVFRSHFITDPQTLELGETRERALLLSYQATSFQLSAAAYDGKIDERGDGNEIDYVVSLIITPRDWLEFGLSYNSNLADSDAEVTRAYRLDSSVEDTVSGTSAFVSLTHKKWELDLEYLQANKSFDVADLDADGDGKGDRPRTYSIELAYAVAGPLTIAARLEGNKDFFDQPARQYGAIAEFALYKNVSASLEYLHGEYKGGDERNIVSAQLAIKF